MEREWIAATAFGLEAVVRREIEQLGYPVLSTEDGRVTFQGHEDAMAKANLWLRSAERVLLKMGSFSAPTFEDLFQQVKGIPWEELIPVDGKIIVDARSVKSTLTSVPAIQSVAAKAVYARLGDFYGMETLPEDGALYPIRVSIRKDQALVTVDTTGEGLHKRGYRTHDVAAPLRETMAAALIQLSFYKKDRILIDLCCGSGTIPIEAALWARNIAPGLKRPFLAEEWDLAKPQVWEKARQEAREAIDEDLSGFKSKKQPGEAQEDSPKSLQITGIDIDPKAIEAAKANALAAGVAEDISFSTMDMANLQPQGENGVFLFNPPYGERIGDAQALMHIYKTIATLREDHPDWSFFFITTDKTIEETLGEKANRRRKLYNGRLEACYYQYHGTKPNHR